MKVHMPLLLTVFAQLSCSNYAPCTSNDAPDSLFELPEGYELRELSEILEETIALDAQDSQSRDGEPGYF